MCIYLFLYFYLIGIAFSSTLPSPELHNKYGGKALHALRNLLLFFESDINDLNLDGLYGLRIAQGQLNALDQILTSTSNRNSRFTDDNRFIKSLSKQIERIANESLIKLAENSGTYLKRFLLVASKPFDIEYEVRKINDELIENGDRNGNFNEDASDSCFSELLGSTDDPNSTKCVITQSCWKLMTSSLSKDYRLTHQLLWFLVAKNIGCFDNRPISLKANKNLKILQDRYCTNIYQDAKMNYKIDYNQDLFLEQILLCSIIGYEDFLRLDWFDKILTWQHSDYGCFSSLSDKIEIDSKRKRHLLVENEMKNGCLSHKSGLASGVLATYARAFLQ